MKLDRTIGVELECYIPEHTYFMTSEALKDAGLKSTHAYRRHADFNYWLVKNDGSLGNGYGGDYGVDIPDDDDLIDHDFATELNSPILNADSLDQITTACKVLNGLDAYTDRSCGLHVHVGVGDVNIISSICHNVYMKRICKQFLAFEYAFILLTDRRRACTSYAKPLSSLTRHSPVDIPSLISYSCNDRYHSLNFAALKEFNTLEFRLFQGSVDAQHVKAIAELCGNFITWSKNHTGRPFDSLKQFYKELSSYSDYLIRTAEYNARENNADIYDIYRKIDFEAQQTELTLDIPFVQYAETNTGLNINSPFVNSSFNEERL